MLSQKLLTRRQFLSFLPTFSMAILGKHIQVQKTNTYNPKFNIGDYVHCQFDNDENPNWYERGEITGIKIDSNGWDYDFIIRECPNSCFIGMPSQSLEEDLVLVHAK